MSTYTPSLGLELITPGSQAGLWGNTTNNSLNLIDQAITGVTPISFAAASGSTHTLTDYNGAEDEARAAVLNVTGSATGSNTIVIPNKQKTYLVRNSTGFDVNIKTLSGSAYVLGDGYNNLVFCDGNNGVFPGILAPGAGTVAVNGGGTGATSFTAGFIKSPGGASALTSSATVSATSEISGTLPVANGGTGAVSLTSGALLIGNGTGTVASLSGGTSGYVATWNGSTWVSAAPVSGAVTSVNGQTGAVSLTATDVGALSTSGTAANSSALGGTAASGFVTTSGTQTISGAKTFSSDVVRSSGGFSALQANAVTVGNSSTGMSSTGSSNIGFQISGSALMTIQFGGCYNPTGVWGTSSDANIKENIEPARNYLNDLDAINIVKYSLKSENSPVPTKLGVIAQEVEQIFPGLVEEDEDGIKAVKMSVFVPMLIKAVQELKAEVAALKAAK